MKKTLYRALTLLVSVALVLSLASPAFATTTTDTFLATSLPADIVISSAMNGIGVLPASDPVPYEGIVSRVKNWLIDQGKVVNDKIDVWKRSVVAEGQWQYGADVSLIEAIRSWLFDEKVVDYVDVQSPVSSLDWAFNDSKSWNYACVAKFVDVSGAELITYAIVRSQGGPLYLAPNSSGYGVTCDYPFWFRSEGYSNFIDYSVGQVAGLSGSTCISIHPFGVDDTPTLGVASGLTAGFIAPGSVVFGEAYPDWYRNIATIPLPGSVPGSDDDEIHALPIAPGNTLSDTFGKTQEQVWAGQSSYTESVPDAGTGSLADVIAAVVAIPGQIINGLKELFIPNISNLTFPLQNFFPFCIPFDLYEFFTLLSAAPEAPVFEWEIPVPQLGRTFELKVDLSPWNDVATLFRNLELLAFIVGLAYVTREKFLRS